MLLYCRHIADVHGNTVCDQCNKSFATVSVMKLHRVCVHNLEDPTLEVRVQIVPMGSGVARGWQGAATPLPSTHYSTAETAHPPPDHKFANFSNTERI